LTLAPVPDPLLTDGDDTRVTMFHPIVTGIRLAVGPAELDRLAESQLTDRWTELADAAATRGQTLFVEPWDDGRLGAALFTRCAGLVQRINHSALRLSLDACQLWRAGLRVRDLCHWYRDQIGHVELPAMSTSQHNDAVRGLRILWRTGLWRTGFRGVVGLRQGLSGPVDGAERQLVTLRQRLESDITGEHHFTMDEL
jgi:sugar phosphate isomerase/epimerase